MNTSNIVEFSPSVSKDFSTAVSLHAHTCHSRELLSFLPRLATSVPVVGRLVEYQVSRYRKYYGRELDFDRTYWRPPLTPRDVIDSEMRSAVAALGLRPIVSLTDHDTFTGSDALARVTLPCEAPLSFEWTLPLGPACFHLGVHNIPRAAAASISEVCAGLTRRPDAGGLLDVLGWFQEMPETLVVVNHPLWDGKGVGAQQRPILLEWLAAHRHVVDALEINGFRSWRENLEVTALAERFRLPLVSGGDRHARAPNAVLNLTRARTFSGFAFEVRRDRRSLIVVMPAYREHPVSRTLEAVAEILASDPHLSASRRWIHRVFHVTDEHGDLPVAHYWKHGEPVWLRCAVGFMCLLGARRLRPARRLALTGALGGIQ